MTNEITNEELARLKALAEAATPGPWYVQYGDDIRHQCMTAISAVNKRDGNDGLFDDDQPLIAVTFHQSYPGVNLEGDDCGDNDSAYITAANPAVILALIAKVESLAADAERYRWLRDMAHPSMGYPRNEVWATDHRDMMIESENLDSIIDAAMAKEKA